MDVVLGSGSIFPVFPPRKLDNFPGPGEAIWLVDGGFAHNSPVEAAVLCGATHIIVIEASPKVRVTRNNFLENALASFDHLYAQAQLLDAHSRGQVLMFTLAPEPPQICVLDFADNLITRTIATGYRDARLTSADGTPRFRKELGRPSFVEFPARD
jgi:predicted acylesterase/phospholipase RssA